MTEYGEGQNWRDSAAWSLDAMYERATKAEAERDKLACQMKKIKDRTAGTGPSAHASVHAIATAALERLEV